VHAAFESLIRQTREQTDQLRALPLGIVYGRLRRASGAILEVDGLPLVIGDLAHVQGARDGQWLEAECIGFEAAKTYLMVLDGVQPMAPGALVLPAVMPRFVDGQYGPQARQSRLPLGPQLLGRVVDGLGRPLDGLGGDQGGPVQRHTGAVNPLRRAMIATPLDTGVRAINAALTIGRGQRIGLFAGSGVGKSVLLSMLARNCAADVLVIALVGERSREVREFCEEHLDDQARQRSVVVAAPADTTALARTKAADYASEVACWFRDQGQHVVLIVDSLSRYAMALREIGLGMGHPPVARGYPASVFSRLPEMVEKAGNGASPQGSLTAFYTVLLEGDDVHDPVADAARGVLDGHIFLSRELADSGHYPAIDIERSISRVMPRVASADHVKAAAKLKALISKHSHSRDLIAMGAYVRGADPQLDFAIKNWDRICAFLQQDADELSQFGVSRDNLLALVRGAP
jgi:flagellum-specific ATP synthase